MEDVALNEEAALLNEEAALLNEYQAIYDYQGGPEIPPILQELRQSINNTVSGTNNPSQLLFISDIEGCLQMAVQKDHEGKIVKDTNMNDNYIVQNVSLCHLKNYLPGRSLFNFLLNNPKNKIAFLGDYFDKGPGVANSIKGITFLHKCFQDRVHIILGNRDVNKFRLGYEVLQPQGMTPDKTWDFWKPFYGKYNVTTADNYTRFRTILNDSMGAGPNPDGAIISNQLYRLGDVHKAARIGAYYLTKVFDDNAKPSDFDIQQYFDDTNNLIIATKPTTHLDTFVKECRYLFKNGDIVKHDPDYNVLMSHAGGFNKCILQPENFFKEIMNPTTTTTHTQGQYFDEMERMRKALDCKNFNYNDDANLVSIDEAVTYHNGLYKNFVTAYFNTTTDRTSILPQHLLLQAMGLKPDKNDEFSFSNFASFIQSCGSGCGMLDDDKSRGFIEKLGTYKAIAHGHVPHCMRHPLLINRNNIVFISNDTSNGNRPYEGGLLSSLPLSYIQKSDESRDNLNYGIGFINNGTIEPSTFDKINFKNDGITKYTNQNPQEYHDLALTGGPYNAVDIPSTDIVKQYIKWPLNFGPADIVNSYVTTTNGKRQKRGGKKNTRRIVKNNRKTKRRNKHHCSHCK